MHTKKKETSFGRVLLSIFFLLLAAAGAVLVLYKNWQAGSLWQPEGRPVYAEESRGAGTASSAAPSVSPPASPAPSAAPAPSAGRLKTTPRADSSYLEETVFIGDSRINGIRYAGAIPSENAFAYNGLSHTGAMTKRFLDLGTGGELTIPEAIGVRKPAYAVVAFGINGIAWIGENSFIQGYEELLDALQKASPGTVFIIQSILPVSASKEQSDSRYANEKIDRYNERLQKLAEEKGLYYLHTAEALKDGAGALAAAYDRGDGLHFSAAASGAIVEYFMTHAAL